MRISTWLEEGPPWSGRSFAKAWRNEDILLCRNRWAGVNQEGLHFVLRYLSCERENFWRILSLGGMMPSPLDDWQQHEGLQGMQPTVLVYTWEADGNLNEVIKGEEQTRYILNNWHSKTVRSCVRKVESKCCRCVWNDFTVGYWYYSEYQKDVLSKRNRKQIDFGDTCWHSFWEDGLVVT